MLQNKWVSAVRVPVGGVVTQRNHGKCWKSVASKARSPNLSVCVRDIKSVCAISSVCDDVFRPRGISDYRLKFSCVTWTQHPSNSDVNTTQRFISLWPTSEKSKVWVVSVVGKVIRYVRREALELFPVPRCSSTAMTVTRTLHMTYLHRPPAHKQMSLCKHLCKHTTQKERKIHRCLDSHT